MLLKRTRLAAALLAAAFVPQASASELEWHPDLGPALELAQAQGKDVLVDFTGSDWCVWCHRLDDEVFAMDEFAAYADENFVLVALDFPKNGGDAWNAMTDDLRERNRAWQEAFGVKGFPTILLMTPDGVAYAKTGYRPDGPVPYVEHLTEFRTGDDRTEMVEAVARFKGDPDNAKGERLEAAYVLYGNVAGDLRGEILETVRAHDKADSRGILATGALEEWKGQFLTRDAEPDWVAMKADAAKRVAALPSLGKQPEFQYMLGVANALSGDPDQAEVCLKDLEALNDGNDRVIPQMSAQLKGLIAAARERAEAPESDEG